MKFNKLLCKVSFVYVFCVILVETNSLQDNCVCESKTSVDDCGCNVDTGNNVSIYPRLQSLLVKNSYGYFHVDLKKKCPFWMEDSKCTMKYCHVDFCEEDTIQKELRDQSVTFKVFIQNEQTEFNVTPTHKLDKNFETITFGMGCFWGAESLFGATKGVLRTTVGYMGGTTDQPKYTKLGDHVEVLEIDYDPEVITYKELLDIFWNNHEYGLSTKVKRQYQSFIFYHTEEQKRLSEISKAEEEIKRNPEIITTEITEAVKFYPAEDYHQKYRLQEHKEFMNSLGINNTEILHSSYVGAKMNGFLVGVGDFLEEVDTLGLTPTQKEYAKHYFEKNQGRGLYC